MSYYLFLDDDRFPNQVTWVELPKVNYKIARTYMDFCSTIEQNGVPIFVTFDHDLADFSAERRESYSYDDGDIVKSFNYDCEYTGYDCAKWLVDFCHDNDIEFPVWGVHSMNNIGAQRIRDYITSALENDFIKVRCHEV